MIECPICGQRVESLKARSHVIPRWAMKMTKEDGHYASLDFRDKVRPKASSEKADLTCKLWCLDCENRFRDDDANGARLFKNRQYVIREVAPDINGKYLGMEIHDPEALSDLRSFVVSLFIRSEIYGKNVKNKSVLGSRFKFYAKAHKERSLNGGNAGLVLFFHLILKDSHSSPVKTRFEGRTCLQMFFCGYDIRMISDVRGPEENDFSKLVTNKAIFIPVFGGVQPGIRKFLDAIPKTGSIARRKNIIPI